MSDGNINNQNIFDELLEYQKLIKKLEEVIISKEGELSLAYNKSKELFEELKKKNNENNELKKEISNLNQKNNELSEKNRELSDVNDILTNQINDIKYQHQKEINSLKTINDLEKNSIINKNEFNTKILEFEKIKNAEILALKTENI